MKALSAQGIIEVKALRSQGIAYKKIASILSLSPATVLKYSKSVRLNNEAKQLLLNNELKNQKKFCGEYSQEKDFRVPKLDEDFANLLGHLFFDGSVCTCNGKFILAFTNASKTAVDNFVSLLWKCMGLRAGKIYLIKGVNVDYYQVECYSKKAYMFLSSISSSFSTTDNIGVPAEIFNANDSIKASFLRAFWDDEGCISHAGTLSGVSKSEKMIRDLVLLQERLGIASWARTTIREDGPIHLIVVAKNKPNFARFMYKIGFEHAIVTKGYHIGKAKKDLLLEKFIEAYHN